MRTMHAFEELGFSLTETNPGIRLWQPQNDVLDATLVIPQLEPCDLLLVGIPKGECGGVRMANQTIGALSLCGSALYGNHEPTHGADATQRFIQLGAHFDTPINDVPVGSTYVISAHGAAPSTHQAAKERGLDVFDVTCPLVVRTHVAVRDAAEQGAHVAYISFGKPDHPEVVGIQGLARELSVPFDIVTSAEDARKLIARLSADTKLSIIGQTTNNADDARELMQDARSFAEKRGIQLVRRELQDVCHTVSDRQRATREIIRRGVSSLVVVGSVNSKNTKSLAHVGIQEAVNIGRKTLDVLLVNSWAQLPNLSETVGVVSGASTLDTNVDHIITRLRPRRVEEVGTNSDSRITFKSTNPKTRKVLV